MHPGGKEGGGATWTIGFILLAVGLYFLFDSVRVTTGGHGFITGAIHARGFGGGDGWETTSMGIVFVPFIVSMIVLFFNAEWRIGWAGLAISIVILMIEMFSRIRFFMNMKTTHLLLILTLSCAGCGMMLRGYMIDRSSSS